MKFHSLLLSSLLFFSSTASAQYFSEGWKPGQAAVPTPSVDTQPPTRPPPSEDSQTPPPKGPSSLASSFDLSKILQTGPVASLFDKMGINITHQLEAARAKVENVWDKRIPLITDDNFEDIIVNEELTPEEEEKRVWFLIITAQTGQSSGMSKVTDEYFDSAYNTSLVEGDLPHVKWGRIDYLNVTYLTTRWAVWQAPYLMVIRHHGKDLYFYQATKVRLTAENMRDFLLNDTWKQTFKWDAPWAPGGNHEYLLHYFAIALQKIYDVMVVIPKWLLMILSGGVASLVMKLMHKNPDQAAVWPDESKKETSEEPKVEAEKEKEKGKGGANKPTATSPTKSKSGPGKGKKGGKK